MFASMAHGATFGELCVRFNPAILNINEKQMVLFGLLEGLIRRVDKYPITVTRNLFFDDEDANTIILQRSTSPSHSTLSPFHIPNGNSSICTSTVHHNKNRISRPLPRGERYNNRISHQNHHHHHSYQQQLHQEQDQKQQQPQQQHILSSQHNQSYFYNGLKSLDEICCKRGISCQQLEMQLARDRHVIVLLK